MDLFSVIDSWLSPLPFVARAHDVFRCALATAGLVANGRHAPRGLRMTAGAGLAFTTTHRVVSRVHGLTMHAWAPAQTAASASRTKFDVLMLFVANRSNTGHTFQAYLANFAAWQP